MKRNLVSFATLCLILVFNILSCTRPSEKETEKATINKLTGKVELKRKDDQNWQTAQVQMELLPQDKIITHQGATCEIVFADESRVKISENTILQLSVPSELKFGKEKGLLANIKIISGRIWCRVKRRFIKKKEFYVETPAAIGGIRGTLFSTYVDRKGNSLISVKVGKLEVFGEKTRVMVNEGYQTEVLMEVKEPKDPEPITEEEEKEWEKIGEWIKEEDMRIKEIEQMGKSSSISSMVALDSIRTALELYRMDYEGYPDSLNPAELNKLSPYLNVSQALQFFNDNKLLSYKSSMNYYEIRVATHNNKVLVATPYGIKEE